MDTPRGDNTRGDHLGATNSDVSAADAAQRIKQAASGAVNTAKNVASDALGKGAEQVERTTQSAASALRRASQECQDEHAWIGTALRKSADGLDRASSALSGGDMRGVFDDVNSFARRQPALFLGVSLALGFAAARVGKTAIERANAEHSDPLTRSDSFGAI
ncbi:Bll8034 protein [alpha proteobacterium U9-1i]|nr:Bll8034 protein [alpha proteobacterium U9-1i]